jgi:hypothetical protein
MAGAEIGEETTTNKVNDTKTIKEKLGRDNIAIDEGIISLPHITNIIGSSMRLKYNILESDRKTMPP